MIASNIREYNETDLMLGRLIRALMTYYGPITIIHNVIIETDLVVREMAVNGHVEEAKKIADVLEGMRKALA